MYILWFNRLPLEPPPASIPSAKSTLRFGQASFELFCRFFCSPESVRQSAPSGFDTAGLRLEVVTWKGLGTVDQTAIHLAQVRQVEEVAGQEKRQGTQRLRYVRIEQYRNRRFASWSSGRTG